MYVNILSILRNALVGKEITYTKYQSGYCDHTPHLGLPLNDNPHFEATGIVKFVDFELGDEDISTGDAFIILLDNGDSLYIMDYES